MYITYIINNMPLKQINKLKIKLIDDLIEDMNNNSNFIEKYVFWIK